jgi:PAS domain S-box-containing protein
MQQDLSAIVPAPLLVSNIEEWPHADARRALYSGEGIVSILLLPLTIRGESTGTLACYYRKRRTSLSALDSKAAAAFAEIASMTLSNERFGQLADVARDVALSVDLEAIVQKITDAATSLTGAKFGAFFYNVINDQGEAYTLYTISGISRDRFAGFPMPRNTAVFTPTFEGTGIVRSPNITKDARYGRTAPYHGMPEGHLPVVSYLAVPVKSRNGEVLGGLFFGDDAENVFGETEEKLAEALASHAAVAIDNFRLYERIQRDRAAARRQERRYRSLAMATPTRQAIVLSNAAGEVIEDSPSWREITGQTTSQMLGGGWIEAIHPRHRREVAERAAAALASRSVFEDRYLLRQTNGSYRWFADKTVPVLGESGEIEEWITTVIDVHEEQASQQMIEFLARASEVFASSLDHRETLRNLAFLVVPNFADWCAVDLATPAGPKEWERIAVAHSDPEKLALAEEFQRRFPPDPVRARSTA